MTSIFLVGPMGAGKTTIGKRVAKAFAMPFFDLDREIEKHTGADVALIFDIEGEEGFRKREAEMLDQMSARSNIVLATGGGSVLDENSRRLLAARGWVVYLKTNVDQQIRRLERDKRRPLLQAPDRRQRLEALHEARDSLYQEIADMVVQSRDAPVKVMAKEVIKLLRESLVDR